jgi:hypothetical protein
LLRPHGICGIVVDEGVYFKIGLGVEYVGIIPISPQGFGYGKAWRICGKKKTLIPRERTSRSGAW